MACEGAHKFASGAARFGMLHAKDDPSFQRLHVHGMLSPRAAATYADAHEMRQRDQPFPGLALSDAVEAEAAAITWLELAEVRASDPLTISFVLDHMAPRDGRRVCGRPARQRLRPHQVRGVQRGDGRATRSSSE